MNVFLLYKSNRDSWLNVDELFHLSDSICIEIENVKIFQWTLHTEFYLFISLLLVAGKSNVDLTN